MPLESLITKAKPLYSSLEEALANLTRNKGTGAEFLKELEKKAGVKQAEIQDRGLDKVLADLPKVDKATVQKAVSNNPKTYVNQFIKYDNPTQHPDYEAAYVDAVNDLSEDRYGRPQRVDPIEAHHRAVETVGGPANYSQIQLPGGSNYREMLLNLPYQKGPEYFGPHWDEPNVLAHMRLSDRTGPNGEKVLHLEELQSDWHQQGREKGYKGSMPIDEARNKLISWGYRPEILGNDNQSIIDEATKYGVPNAPFKKNWEELALKHLINHAVDNGYDKIAITPGAVQADRYDLSKQIANVEYNELGDLRAYDHNGRRVLSQNVLPEKVSDYVGKELGAKIAENHANRIQARSDYRTAIKNDAPDDQVDALYQQYLSHPTEYSGLDLQVGGEGMKAAYDQRIPNILNKIGKPFGAETQLNGMTVETKPSTNFQVRDTANPDRDPVRFMQATDAARFVSAKPNSADLVIEPQPAEYANLHSFDITPELKQQVQTQGLPQYKKGGDVKLSHNPDSIWMELTNQKLKGKLK